MSTKSQKPKKYYVLHQSALRINQSKDRDRDISQHTTRRMNIFDEIVQGKEDWDRSQGGMGNPFSLTEAEEGGGGRVGKGLGLGRIGGDGELGDLKNRRLNTETIYKMSKIPSIKLPLKQKNLRSSQTNTHSTNPNLKMPILPDRRPSILTQRSGSTPLTLSNSTRLQKIDQKVQKYLYHHSIISEVVYNKDLRTRCGDQYFQQLLRDRHQEEFKPVPFVYSLKANVEPNYSGFVKYVRTVHPEIKIREKMKLIGVNRNRIRTQQSYDEETKPLKNKPRIRINTSKIKNQITQEQQF